MSDIGERVIKIIADQIGGDPDRVVPTARFLDDLAADSLDVVELVMALEDELGVVISDQDAEQLATVQDAITYIEAAAKKA